MSAAVLEHTKLARELWHISGTGDVKRLDQLLAKGADVNAGDRTGVTALMRAAYHGQLPMVRALIEHGADPNAKDRGGLTALMMAKHAGHEEIVEALLSFGAQGKRESASKPRLVAYVTDERIGAAHAHYDATPSKSLQVRTLHEPPEIWDLVHTTSLESDSPPAAARRFSFARPLMFGSALIICAGALFGLLSLLYLRGAGSNSAARNEQEHKAITTQPPLVSRQPAAAAKTRNDERNRIIPPANDPPNPKPAEKVTSKRAVQATAPVAAAVALSARKDAPKTRNNAKKASSPSSLKEDDSARKPAKSERGESENSASLKKDPSKAQTQQASEPAKSSATPKPKVIQWP